MSKFTTKVEHLPSITEFEMTISQLRSILQPLGLRELRLWDNYWTIAVGVSRLLSFP